MDTKDVVSPIEKAMQFAQSKHSGQYRKTRNVPYVMHVFSVANNVARFKNNSNNLDLLQIAAILHDTVEDCDVSLAEIAAEFGYKVAALVEELTTDKQECKRVGKTQYLMEKMAKMSSYALLIKLCDRYDNLTDLGRGTEDFRKKYIAETNAILDHIVSHGRITATHSDVIREIRGLISKH